MQKQKLVMPLAAIALVLSAGGGVVAAAHADSTSASTSSAQTAHAQRQKPAAFGHGGLGDRGHGIHGTVTAISGTTLTVQGANGTTYTVDASGATAAKIQTISISQVTVGDSVDVGGTVSGTSVTAKHLLDGVPQHPKTKSS